MRKGTILKSKGPQSSPAEFSLWTRNNVKDRWQCSLETLKRKEKAGLLPFIKIGKFVRYRPEVIEAIERQGEINA
jgi:hypothetical protein